MPSASTQDTWEFPLAQGLRNHDIAKVSLCLVLCLCLDLLLEVQQVQQGLRLGIGLALQELGTNVLLDLLRWRESGSKHPVSPVQQLAMGLQAPGEPPSLGSPQPPAILHPRASP